MGEPARAQRTEPPAQPGRITTLLDLVAAVAEVARNEKELVATVRNMVNSGRVRLVGHFRGADVRIG